MATANLINRGADYQGWIDWMARHPRKHNIGRNTTVRRDGDAVVIRYHSTDIVTFRPDRVDYNTGGWETVTTKGRMNDLGPLHINQEDGTWYAGVGAYWARNELPWPLLGSKFSAVEIDGRWVLEQEGKLCLQ